MDEKQQQRQQPPAMSPPIRGVCHNRRNRPLLPLLLIAAFMYCFYHLHSLSQFKTDRWADRLAAAHGAQPVQPATAKVPLEAHIMSKCPDARDCLRDLILPAMQKAHDKVNFTLSFIGRPTDNDGVACKHGPEECLGNIIELCAQELYPDPKSFLGFTMCMTRDYRHIPQRSLVEDCALEHALDFDELNKCATKDDGGYGVGMLRSSVRRSSEVHRANPLDLSESIY
ncbi:hypothetical protein QBC34DRAFT_379013 [Podospora aff. communis PSN243]|uniref:Gamma interferon inducible lysosomal thiol reductase n=1 Tax=Podospora aff. communis PSN243 TaxID=3040156 RepID=A0AAV9GQ71_9PEZI|nr:hypothetical protein QBC34DRAFT_379013 [Podospora aff. communis PSN243]